MTLTAGIDLGTSGVKVALLEVADALRYGNEPRVRVISLTSERIRRRMPHVVCRENFEMALADAGLGEGELDYIASTGDGEGVPFHTGHFYGMTTHARGGLYLVPEATAVLDIGSLHARAILMDDKARVLKSRMTSQCASGSGQFLENITRYLGVTLEEVGPLSLSADNPEQVSGICAVLAETDVINMVSRGITAANIIKGIHVSMAGRLVKLLDMIRASGAVALTGGLAADKGLTRAIEEVASSTQHGIRVVAHEKAMYAGAIGAALWGAYRHEVLARRGDTALTRGGRV